MNKIIIRKVVNYALLVVLLLIIISGYGISNHKIVESLTFGLLDKARSFRLHKFLDLFLIALLLLHVFPFLHRKKQPSIDQNKNKN
ncbi:hypothetical protein HOK15_06320 [Candidatus Falkowbacteria bacterium]|jgi:hypothetical protein|nr:hypothetical protein [Candidatus Falkowbacteria bacterium]